MIVCINVFFYLENLQHFLVMGLVSPAAITSEISSRGALPCAACFLDGKNSATPAQTTAAFDYRYKCMGVSVIESRNSQITHVSDLLVWLACSSIASMSYQAVLHLRKLSREQYTVPLCDRKLLFPLMTLPVCRHKIVRHLVFFLRGRLQTTSIHLRNICDRLACER